MELTASYLRDQAIQIEHALTEMGMTSVDCEIRLNYSVYTEANVSLKFYALDEYQSRGFSAVTIADLPEALTEAWTYVRGLKSAADLRKYAFMKRFSDVIAEARELDLPVDWVSPLEESMRKLSENILEDHSGESA